VTRYDDAQGEPGPEIRVDIGGLHDFAAAVRGHVDSALRGEVERAFTAYGQGVLFGYGWSAHSGDIRAARQRYHACPSTTSETLADFVEEAEAMVAAVEVVAQRYGETDALVAASAADIEAALSQAYTSERAERAQERARERRFE
jgi:hypothetical protein